MLTVIRNCKGYLEISSLDDPGMLCFDFKGELSDKLNTYQSGRMETPQGHEYKIGDVLEVECVAFVKHDKAGHYHFTLSAVHELNPEPVKDPDVIKMSGRTLLDQIHERRIYNGEWSHSAVVLFGAGAIKHYKSGDNLDAKKLGEHVYEYMSNSAEEAASHIGSLTLICGGKFISIQDPAEVSRFAEAFSLQRKPSGADACQKLK